MNVNIKVIQNTYLKLESNFDRVGSSTFKIDCTRLSNRNSLNEKTLYTV